MINLDKVWVILTITPILFMLNAEGQSLAVERFDSLPGTLHNYQGTSTGWFTNWRSQNDYTGPDGYSISNTTAMTHPEVTSVGNYCVGGGDFTSAGRFFNVVGAFSDFEDANGRIGVGTIYFSFLIRKDEDNDTPIEIIFADSQGAAWAINQELIKVGYFGASSNFGGERYWSIAVFDEATVALSDSVIAIDETYQIIVEIDFGATTTVNMWVNPTDGSPNLSTPDASASSTEDLGFWNIVLYFDALGTGHGGFDEFVFSDNLGIVLPVTYTDFYAETRNEYIKLLWSTATEKSNDRFIVQHSRNGTDWENAGIVPGNGDSNELIDYSFEDHYPLSGLNYYRLIQVDYNGERNVSKIIRAEYDMGITSRVRVLKSGDKLNFIADSKIKEIRLIDLNGRLLSQYSPLISQYSISIPSANQKIILAIVTTEAGVFREKILLY